MTQIRLLDKHTIDKIAAGEVVDRPASVVKELVENSIDAGSSAISVEIRDGGTSLIRITDNGSGIPKEQVAVAFQRHSTSKIQEAEDLSFIHTLGFRGEALSSIAAVSRTQLCTKTSSSLTGTIYIVNGGAEESLQDAGLPDGTTVIVKDLFYNTPARKKFLKSSQSEAGYVTDVMNRISLSHPEIAWKYTVNGALKLSTSGNGSLKDAIYSIFGRDITSHLLRIEDNDETLSVCGYIGKPEISRGNRGFEYFFINGRFIRDRILTKALEEAYIGYHMKGTFPFAVLNVMMEPELVDVNVHPSKMEVRFFNNEAVFRSIYDMVRRLVTQRESIPDMQIGPKETVRNEMPVKASSIPEPFERPDNAAVSEQSANVPGQEISRQLSVPEQPPASIRMSVQAKSVDIPPKYDAVQEQVSWPVHEETRFLDKVSRTKHRIIGSAFETYWIVEFEDSLYLIDQHAAHEKVLYEQFVRRIRSEQHYAQKILPSLILTLSSEEEATFLQHREAFQKTGFEVEHFGGNEYALSAVPADLYHVDPSQLFLHMLEDLRETSAKHGPEIMTDRIATAACKAAVKGGSTLTAAEADALIDELLNLDNPYNCPHGRPTMIRMSRYELERKFKRIL